MKGLSSGMNIGFGFLLFCALLSFLWIIFQNLKKRMFPLERPLNINNLPDYQGEEKRKEKRVDIIWPVSVKINNEIIKAETKELNRSGAFIKCSKPLVTGERFVLTIETPSKGFISLKSEVVWSNASIPEEKVVTSGMGIRFIQNMDKDLMLLKSALEEHIESLKITIPVQKQ